jgi:Cof subfamily protein (haloacid dehalogenase superfamily)
MKKLLVIDLDGTLLTDNKKITEKARNSLRKAQEKGVEVCIATGRDFNSAKHFPIRFDLRFHMICSNGAMIKDPFSLRELFRLSVDTKDVKEVLKYALEIDTLLHIFTEHDWYISKVAHSAINYGRSNNLTYKMIQDIENWEELDIIKMVVVDTPEKIDMLEEWVKNRGLAINLVRSDSRSIDLTHKNASKGNAVKWLSKYLGIEKENIIAIGNYYNDIDMFKVANIGVAMNNSPDLVKKEADYVTKSNEDDGVALFIDKYILNL